MNATIILLVALPVVGAVIGAAGIWLSKRSMPSRRVPASRQFQAPYTAPTVKAFPQETIAAHHG